MSALLQVSNLQVSSRRVRAANGQARGALHGTSFELDKGETLGIVGESGSGKRTLAHTILRLIQPDSGEVHFVEHSVGGLRGAALRDYRREVQLVGPNPRAALNPRFTVADSLAEPLRTYRLCPSREVTAVVEQMLTRVGLEPAVKRRLPEDLTPEQALRIALARALSLEPQVLILDEPETALDPSTMAQVFHLVAELQDAMQFALIFMTGNPGTARYLCRQMAVMYLGRIVEIGPTEAIIAEPRHPYRQAPLASMPRITRPTMPPVAALPGDPPAGSALPPGCAFHPRCPRVMDQCRSGAAPIRRMDGEIAVWCHLYPEAPDIRR